MTALLISVAFAVASAGAYALGAIAQERLAVRLGAQTPWRDILRALLRARRWWLSVALNAAGGGLHVAALAYGPLSVVQPLGVLTLVLALPIGAAVSAQRITRRQWGGATATVAGLVLLLVLTVPGSGDGMDAGDADLLVLTSAAVLVATIAGTILVRRPVPRSLMYAAAAGVAFAIASALTHAVTREYADGGPSALLTPTMPAIAAMAVAGVLLSQLAYRGSGLGAPLATVTLANPVASAIIGVVLFEERFATGPVAMTLLVAAGATAGAGILLLAPPSAPSAAPPTVPAEPVADDQSPRTPALCRR